MAIRRGDDLGVAPQVVKIVVEGAENDVIAGLASRRSPCCSSRTATGTVLPPRWPRTGTTPTATSRTLGTIVPFHGVTTNTFDLLYEHLRGFCSSVSLGSAQM